MPAMPTVSSMLLTMLVMTLTMFEITFRTMNMFTMAFGAVLRACRTVTLVRPLAISTISADIRPKVVIVMTSDRTMNTITCLARIVWKKPSRLRA